MFESILFNKIKKRKFFQVQIRYKVIEKHEKKLVFNYLNNVNITIAQKK